MFDPRIFDPIVEILAFLGATRNYSYIDRLGNSIDEISILEAVRDALRAYYTWCGSPPQPGKIEELSDGTKVRCPDVEEKSLNKAAEVLVGYLNGKSRIDRVKLARELSLKAYAKIPNYIIKEEATQR